MDRSCQELVQNGSAWLRAILHCTCCQDSSACEVPGCAFVREILKHLHSAPRSHCAAGTCEGGAACPQLRQLTAHYVACQDPMCRLCVGVCQDLTPAQPSMNSSGATGARAPACYCPHHDVDTDSKSSSGWGDDETDPAMVEHECDCVHGLYSDSMPSVAGAASFSPDALQLVAFAELLLHSLLRWQGATAPPVTSPSLLVAVADQGGLQQGRGLWTHMMTGCARTSDVCPHPGCMQARHILLHILDCQNDGCTLCQPIKRAFVAGPCNPVPQSVENRATDMQNWMQDVEKALVRLRL